MLDSVKFSIDSVEDIPFPLYFQQYILKVQDENISYEFKYLQLHNVLDILSLDKLISKYFDQMVI